MQTVLLRSTRPTAPRAAAAVPARRACAVAPARRPGRVGVVGAPLTRDVVRRGLFGLGVPELAVIAGVAALIFGPSKLPQLGKELGKTAKSFQTAAKEFEKELKEGAEEADKKKDELSVASRLTLASTLVASLASAAVIRTAAASHPPHADPHADAHARHHHHRPQLILLHGSFVGGWIWRWPSPGAPAGLAGLLAAAGYDVHTPTLPGHAPAGPRARYTPARAAVTTAECVAYVVDYVANVTAAAPRGAPVAVVAHSYGGIYLQEAVAALQRGTITHAVWANAWVLTPGESFASCALTGWVDRALARVPANRFPPWHPVSRVEAAIARRLYFNDVDGVLPPADADAMAAGVYAESVYEALAPAFDRHALANFSRRVAAGGDGGDGGGGDGRRHAAPPRLGYIVFGADATGAPAQWAGFADRLADAGGRPPVLARVPGGGHLAIVTRPAEVAQAVVTVLDGCGETADG